MYGLLAQVADPDVVQLASDAGTVIRNTAIAVIQVLLPLAVAVYLAHRALPWAKRLLFDGGSGGGMFYSYDNDEDITEGEWRCRRCHASEARIEVYGHYQSCSDDG